jgi:hypothetical protein
MDYGEEIALITTPGSIAWIFKVCLPALRSGNGTFAMT